MQLDGFLSMDVQGKAELRVRLYSDLFLVRAVD